MNQLLRQIKQTTHDARIWWHYGTPTPEKARLVDTNRFVYADSNDPRARKKIFLDSARRRFPKNQRFWRRAIELMEPTTVLDVGVNYGECLFSTLLPRQARAFGFEANPQLRPWLERSLAEHPDAERIDLAFQLVGDTEGEQADFYIQKNWSGGSTAGLAAGTFDPQEFQHIAVPKCSLDCFLRAREHSAERLFFKIDVEGYEYRVLLGMQSTLEAAHRSLGFIEFSKRFLERAGEDLALVWKYLGEHFNVYAFTRGDTWFCANSLSLEQLASRLGHHFHTDLVLCDRDSTGLAESILSFWQEEAFSRDRQVA